MLAMTDEPIKSKGAAELLSQRPEFSAHLDKVLNLLCACALEIEMLDNLLKNTTDE